MPPRPLPVTRDIDRVNHITESSCLAIVNYVVGRLTEPVVPAQGTGCVMAAGGKYLKYAYITISRMREEGYNIPIEIWHLGAKEVTDRDRARFKHLNVRFVDAHLVAEKHPMRRLKGWELKGYAVKYTQFRHVLLLDADSVPVQDPLPLFASKEYSEHGAIFWPDIKDCRPSNLIFTLLGLKIPQKYIEAEAGQLMVDKVRNWKAVCLMNWMNSQSDFFYLHHHGDKEVWPLAFMKLKHGFLLGPPCAWKGYGIEHYWFDGSTAFEHHLSAKRDADAHIPWRHYELYEEFELT